MKISKKQLQSLINEEMSRVIQGPLDEARPPSDHLEQDEKFHTRTMYDCKPSDLVAFAKAYAKLSEQEQMDLNELINSPKDASISHDSVRKFENVFYGMNEEIDEAINEWDVNNSYVETDEYSGEDFDVEEYRKKHGGENIDPMEKIRNMPGAWADKRPEHKRK